MGLGMSINCQYCTLLGVDEWRGRDGGCDEQREGVLTRNLFKRVHKIHNDKEAQ